MAEERTQQDGQTPVPLLLTELETDTIGEILNISMGSAATAISTMLDKQVIISTPNVEVRKFDSVDYSTLEPAMLVKINYVQGISGSNVMIFRQRDMQIILNLLMGNDEPPDDAFVFDELSMSAACEVMNQMMGSSATALSEFLGRPINISTPDAVIVDSEDTYRRAVEVKEGDEIVSVSFRLTIEGVMNSDFASIMSCELTKEIVDTVMGQQALDVENIQPMAQESAPPPMPAPPPAAPYTPPAAAYSPPPAQAGAAAGYPPEAAPQQMPPPGYPAETGMPPQGYPPMGGQYGQQMYPPQYPPYGYPPYGYPQQMPYGYGMPPQGEGAPASASHAVLKQPMNVQNTQFPQFSPQNTDNPATNSNMDLLMGVSLDVSVEIGKTKRKIKDIIDFGQGTVIELNKQAGAPVDIVVNGRLLARGDVVVIDDNFGVRVTEIVGTKELMDSLKEEIL